MAMTFTRRHFIAGLSLTPLAAQNAPRRLPRKDCYFGLHFDLHPAKTDTTLGRDVNDEMVDRLLVRVRPDFVQYDCKGHVGYLGFPSKTGNSAPGIVKDSLEVWRRVSAQRGVALYIHFSGVWDSLAVQQHPDWARVRADGTPEDRITSTFGPYVDKLMIPELDEAISRYSLDGAWIDGECWATGPDYSAAAQKAFLARSGLKELPKKAGDAGWLEFLEFNRAQFRRYVRHYVDALHKLHPDVQLASNWLYSSFVPERPEIPVDYLSGDFLGATPVSTARLESRYLASTGMPWDLMAWGFVVDRAGKSHILKRAAQLKQEAAAVITQGGGFQIYYNPTRAGWIDERLMEMMTEVAQFCRERQEFCFRTEPVPQVGVLFSRHSLYTRSNRMFGSWGAAVDPARGAIEALLAAHYSVEIIPDWKLADIRRYPVIVAPDWPDIGVEARDALAEYSRNGGTLVVLGADNAKAFAEIAGVRVSGIAESEGVMLGDTGFAAAPGMWASIEPGNANVSEQRFPSYDTRNGGVPGVLIANPGHGKMVVIGGPIGAAYATTHQASMHELLRRVLRRVFAPMVAITGPGTVELSLRKKEDLLILHLVNTTAMQVGPDFPVIEQVPAIGPIRVSFKLMKQPIRVTWEPGGRRLEGTWDNGVFQTTVPRIEVHGAVTVQS